MGKTRDNSLVGLKSNDSKEFNYFEVLPEIESGERNNSNNSFSLSNQYSTESIIKGGGRSGSQNTYTGIRSIIAQKSSTRVNLISDMNESLGDMMPISIKENKQTSKPGFYLTNKK